MGHSGKSISTKCIQSLLWMHLLVYVGLNLFQFTNFLSAQIELSENVNDRTTVFDESFVGEEETENKQVSISSFHSMDSAPNEFQHEKSKKITSFYSFHNSPAAQDILSPPPQI